jgi:hypothetical protein
MPRLLGNPGESCQASSPRGSTPTDRFGEKAGLFFYTLLGGEPFLYPGLWEVLQHHRDCYFKSSPTAIGIDKRVASRWRKLGNVTRWSVWMVLDRPMIGGGAPELTTGFARHSVIFGKSSFSSGLLLPSRGIISRRFLVRRFVREMVGRWCYVSLVLYPPAHG